MISKNMSRIEKGSEVKEELQQIKGEVIKEISSTKNKHPIRNCSCLILITVILILSAGAWVVASTGLVEIPVFEKFAYKKPEPERLVASGIPVEKVIEEQILSKFTSGALDGIVELTLTESSLTASLKSVLESGASGFFDASRSQVTISSERGLTFFLPLENSETATALTVSVKAKFENGKVAIEPEEFFVGSMKVPNSVLALLLQSFLKDQFAELNKVLGSYIEIQEVEYKEGEITIRGNAAVEIKE